MTCTEWNDWVEDTNHQPTLINKTLRTETIPILWIGNLPPHRWQWQTNNRTHPVQSGEKTDGLLKKSFSHTEIREDVFDVEITDILSSSVILHSPNLDMWQLLWIQNKDKRRRPPHRMMIWKKSNPCTKLCIRGTSKYGNEIVIWLATIWKSIYEYTSLHCTEPDRL